MEAPVRDLLTNDTQPPTLSPAVPPYVKLGLTIAYTVFYSLLFLFVYVQLWLILHYRHKRFSYQTVFLFLCLLWAGLRTVLFSFYFRNFVTANSLSPFVFWLLYCFPVCLQFFTLSLMNLYFVQVIYKEINKIVVLWSLNIYSFHFRLPLYLIFLSISLIFMVVNLTCALLVKMSNTDPKNIVLVRVAINDTLFVICAISLSTCLYKIAKMSLANIYLESKADLKSLGDEGYVVFGVILFVWELLPTTLVVFFFRVQRPAQDGVSYIGLDHLTCTIDMPPW
ncbi:G protein-coupled receptor 137Ba-like [Acipenser oxyrinchus oxyrinchus]|uniref:G protein-coupled receptor 137Ba-like n=1 Tax=Acipenser oxyrinchus oxyrinchus TaxID=40147 RepID=A0AAD8GAA9_ACIOX|nr:G protein-coupled receptor 137Ba-like [Acipenser oxyrinchus oxyrinchus]